MSEALIEQRRVLRGVEVDRLLEALDLAATSHDLVAMASLLVAGRELAPDRFAAPWQRFSSELPTHDAEVEAAQAAAILYEAARTPQERRRWRQFANSTLARWRYTEGEREKTLSEQEGVSRAMAHRGIDTLLSDYVDPPGDDLLLPGTRRLQELNLLGSSPVPSADLHASIDAILDAAIAHGTPESTATAEFTEAVFTGLDEWSAPIWPAQIDAWERHHQGVAEGVLGVMIDQDEAGLYIRQLVEGASAWAANVHVDDRLLAINGEPVSNDLDAAAKALRGPDGSSVELKLKRADAIRTYTITRGSVPERTVTGWNRAGLAWNIWAEPGIAFLHINSFRPRTAATFAKMLPSAAMTKGLILDLRDNRGGDLDSALAIADRFVSEGPLVKVHTRVQLDRSPDWGMATPHSPWTEVPTVVLVNRHTASSAEILAGALQAAGAMVIGEGTTGKGTGQLLRVEEELGFAMQFTHLRWSLPSGQTLHRTDDALRWGITPDLLDIPSPTEAFITRVMRERREALPVHADGSDLPYRGTEIDPSLPPLSHDPHIQLALAHTHP